MIIFLKSLETLQIFAFVVLSWNKIIIMLIVSVSFKAEFPEIMMQCAPASPTVILEARLL